MALGSIARLVRRNTRAGLIRDFMVGLPTHP